MTQKLLTLPFRLGFGAARTAFDISTKTLDVSTTLLGTAIGLIRSPEDHDTARQDPETPQDAPSTTPTSTTEPPTEPSKESRVNGHQSQTVSAPPAARPPAPPPEPAAPITPPAEQPDTPLTPEQDAIKTLDPQDEEELVAEFADPGAEDGAGAQLDVEEPWEGYGGMNASTVIARIEQADPAQLAIVELYEQTHKKRQTVLSAATKRLRALSPPAA